jgi:hypothetical protein
MPSMEEKDEPLKFFLFFLFVFYVSGAWYNDDNNTVIIPKRSIHPQSGNKRPCCRDIALTCDELSLTIDGLATLI